MMSVASLALGAGTLVALQGCGSAPTPSPAPPSETNALGEAYVKNCQAFVPSDPSTNGWYGCGLVGDIPGIQGGDVTPSMQTFLEDLKKTSGYGKVSYWNWNIVLTPDEANLMTSDFIFMPDNWGMDAVATKKDSPPLAKAAAAIEGSEAQFADILLGADQPDIHGGCLGGMLGTCTSACAADASECPECHQNAKPGSEEPNAEGGCDCWSSSSANSVGFWDVAGCKGSQPLPKMFDDEFDDEDCVDLVMGWNAETGKTAAEHGYKYMSTPQLSFNTSWMKSWVKKACTGCSEISCGCPSHLGWHFFAQDCQPKSLGDYAAFQAQLDTTAELMEEFPNLKGGLWNEVGMKDCVVDTPGGPCVPGSGKYPAAQQPGNTCPKTDELPNGMVSFVETLIQMAANTTTKDKRPVVVGFTWSNSYNDGTYDQRLFKPSNTSNTSQLIVL